MAKRKKKNTNTNNKILTIIAWLLTIIAIIISALITGYYFGYEEAKNEIINKEKVAKAKRLNVLKELESITNVKPKENVNTRLKDILKNQPKNTTSATHEYEDVSKLPPRNIDRKIIRVSTKPQLVIIIDDVSVKSQVNAIKALKLPITMSFLPPSPLRPNSAKLASKENFYMVHLPMEALKFNKEEPFTLKANDSKQTIKKRITALVKLFPRVRFINNHTGSKFTSSEIAMNRLITVLNAKKISFIDSRTTAKTKAPKVMKNFGLKYIGRDIFLDNNNNKTYIISQIKKAIQSAKLHGTAIAIGHPHQNTILAINESKKLFKDVELIYVSKLR